MTLYNTGYADIDLDELSPEARAEIEALNLRGILCADSHGSAKDSLRVSYS